MTPITYGKGPLGPVYERLRKRSYRLRIAGRQGYTLTATHKIYMQGVKDALNEAQKEMVR